MRPLSVIQLLCYLTLLNLYRCHAQDLVPEVVACFGEVGFFLILEDVEQGTAFNNCKARGLNLTRISSFEEFDTIRDLRQEHDVRDDIWIGKIIFSWL